MGERREVVGERKDVVGSNREYVTDQKRASAGKWKEDKIGLDNVRSDW